MSYLYTRSIHLEFRITVTLFNDINLHLWIIQIDISQNESMLKNYLFQDI